MTVSGCRVWCAVTEIHVEVLFKLPGSEHAPHGVFLGRSVVAIAQVDVVDSAPLAVGEPQFVGHSIYHDTGFSASVLVCICLSCEGYRHRQHQCHHQLFHNRNLLLRVKHSVVS